MRRWLRRRLCAASRLSEVEVISALERRCREGAFSPAEKDRAISALRRDLDHLIVVELTAPVVDLAAGLLARHSLRAGDAVQLACGLELKQRLSYAVGFVGFDDRLTVAARLEGLDIPDAENPQRQ